jgi:hypothetical protein
MEAAVGLELAQELRLVESFVDAVAIVTGTGELALLRHLGHRKPVDGRIELSGRRFIRRRHRGEVHDLARLGLDLGGVDKPVAAHPHAVFGLRQLRKHVAALVVGDHDLGHPGGELGRLCNHPHASLRPIRPGDDAAEIGRADADRCCLLCIQSCRRAGQKCCDRNRCNA